MKTLIVIAVVLFSVQANSATLKDGSVCTHSSQCQSDMCADAKGHNDQHGTMWCGVVLTNGQFCELDKECASGYCKGYSYGSIGGECKTKGQDDE